MKEKYRVALSGWRELNEHIFKFSLNEIKEMIAIEQNSGRPRTTLIERMQERQRQMENGK